ncbi:hypothetical protein FHG87_003310 [Trinorchestia longiramus]|nr:hypothetical protein FHG87_003310 [Trinorchestia longiramus]
MFVCSYEYFLAVSICLNLHHIPHSWPLQSTLVHELGAEKRPSVRNIRTLSLRQQARVCIKEEIEENTSQAADQRSSKMSSLATLLLVCLVGFSAAVPAEERGDVEANIIFDSVVQRAADNIAALGWDVSKKVQNSYTDIPLEVDDEPDTVERLSITDANIVGFNSLSRSKSAKLNTDESVLTGTVKFTNVSVIAKYDVTFAGVGEAKPDVRDGQVTERLSTIFADVELKLVDRVPQNILSYNVRTGNDKLDSLTNMEDSEMVAIQQAGFRKALRELIENTVATNIKVQINKAVQALKAEA